MQNTVIAVLEDKMNYYLVAKTYLIPQTLKRKVKQARKNDNIIQELKVSLAPVSDIFS